MITLTLLEAVFLDSCTACYTLRWKTKLLPEYTWVFLNDQRETSITLFNACNVIFVVRQMLIYKTENYSMHHWTVF